MTIALDKCRHGVLYKLRSRNLLMGVYDNETGSFLGLRTKFNEVFLDREFHRELPHGTALPVDALEECPVDDLTLRSQELFDWLDMAKGRHDGF